MTTGGVMQSLGMGFSSLSLNPAKRLAEMRQERTVIAIRAKMDPRFATSQAALRRVSRTQQARKRVKTRGARIKVNS